MAGRKSRLYLDFSLSYNKIGRKRRSRKTRANIKIGSFLSREQNVFGRFREDFSERGRMELKRYRVIGETHFELSVRARDEEDAILEAKSAFSGIFDIPVDVLIWKAREEKSNEEIITPLRGLRKVSCQV